MKLFSGGAVQSKKITISVLLLFLAVGLAGCVCCKDFASFAEERGDVHHQAVSVLIKHGACENLHYNCLDGACKKKSPGCSSCTNGPVEGGFVLFTCGVTDAAAIEEIKQIVVRKFNETPQMTRASYIAYGKSRDAGNGCPGLFRSRISGLNLKRNKPVTVQEKKK